MLYLASRSPRRAELLQQIHLRFETRPADIDESPLPGETPAAYVLRMAEEKARAVWQALAGTGEHAVLGADTSVVLDDALLGKPRDRSDAETMLHRLSGRSHQVLSAVCLIREHFCQSRLQCSQVRFRPLESAEIQAYCATDEPMDKAGAYAIQGYAAIFVERLEGSYSGVMGLPLLETWQLLKESTCL